MTTLRTLIAALVLMTGLASTVSAVSTTLGAEGALITWTFTGLFLDGYPGINSNEDYSSSCTAAATVATCIVQGQKITFTGTAGELSTNALAANSVITGNSSSCQPLWGSNETASNTKAVTLTVISDGVCTHDADISFIAYFPRTCGGPNAGRSFRVRGHIKGSSATPGYVCSTV